MPSNTAWRLPSKGQGISALKKVEEPLPKPKSRQYLVRIHAVSLNYRDIAIINGNYGGSAKDNLVLGGDMGGEIVEAGEDAIKFKVGDHVTSIFDQTHFYGNTADNVPLGGPVDGTLQEYRVFDEITLLLAPSYLSYEEISCFPIAAVTAWNALIGSGSGISLVPGQTVLIQGTGGVSIFALQIAQAAGARTIVTSSSDAKLEIAKKLGATHVINYKKTPEWDKEVKRITNGVGVHRIIDNVGISEIERCFNSIARGGVINNIGFLGGLTPEKAINVPILALWTGSIMRGILVGSKQQFEELLLFAEVHELRPHIDKVFEFDQTVQALEYLQSAQHIGKIVVRVSPA